MGVLLSVNKIEVVAAAIIKDQQVLAMQRSEAMTLPGFWEFPGGKIEAGESEVDALIREIKEELTVDIEIIEYINEFSYEYDFGVVSLKVYTAEMTAGSIQLIEHSDKKWLAADDLLALNWAPVDIPAVEILAKKLA